MLCHKEVEVVWKLEGIERDKTIDAIYFNSSKALMIRYVTKN